MWEQILEKDSVPVQFNFFELFKNQGQANNNASYLCRVIENNYLIARQKIFWDKQ